MFAQWTEEVVTLNTSSLLHSADSNHHRVMKLGRINQLQQGTHGVKANPPRNTLLPTHPSVEFQWVFHAQKNVVKLPNQIYNANRSQTEPLDVKCGRVVISIVVSISWAVRFSIPCTAVPLVLSVIYFPYIWFGHLI